jgi:hypothetical protein
MMMMVLIIGVVDVVLHAILQEQEVTIEELEELIHLAN